VAEYRAQAETTLTLNKENKERVFTGSTQKYEGAVKLFIMVIITTTVVSIITYVTLKRYDH
jgi:hypothetical protein